MKSVLLKLREYHNSLSPTEQSIAGYVSANAQEVVQYSIYQLAEQAFVSPSTIIRFCRHLGYQGYKDFHQSLIQELAIRHQTAEVERKEITRWDSIDQIVEKVTYKNIMSLEETKNLLDIAILEQCVEQLCQCKTVLLFGIGSSLCVAEDAYLKFLRLNKPCIINSDWHAQLISARNATSQDLGLVFSYSGETTEIISCMKALKENQTPIITITRYSASPVAELGDYNLYISSSESLFRNGAMSSRISQLNVVDILYTAFASREYEYCIEQLSKTHIQKRNTSPGIPSL